MSLPVSMCKRCSGTGVYHEQQDGGESDIWCDCEIGQQLQKEWEESESS